MVSKENIKQAKETPGQREFKIACLTAGLKSATLTLQMLNNKTGSLVQHQGTGLPVTRIFIRACCYGLGAWLWVNLVVQIAFHFQ